MWQDGWVKTHLRNGAPRGRRRTPDQIAAILQEHRQSGLSLLAFAHKRQLCYCTLLRWRQQATKHPRAGISRRKIGPRFIPIQIEPGPFNADYVLSWPQGRSLKIPPRFDPHDLSRLLEILEDRK